MIADLTDQKLVFGMCMIMQVLTMEILRVSKPLTYNLIFIVKVLRTTTAPSSTLTTTASFKLTEGTNEGLTLRYYYNAFLTSAPVSAVMFQNERSKIGSIFPHDLELCLIVATRCDRAVSLELNWDSHSILPSSHFFRLRSAKNVRITCMGQWCLYIGILN